MLNNDKRRLERLARIKIEGGLLPSVTLLIDLIKFLNQPRTKQGKKIVMILEKMLELEKITKPIPPRGADDRCFRVEADRSTKISTSLGHPNCQAILERELSKYRFTPHVAVVMGGGDRNPSRWSVWWQGNLTSESAMNVRMHASEALELILKLTQAGDLSRLRRCAQCQEWLFARFEHQKFCSTKCQQKHYTQSETWKAHRRRYMRGYYKKHYGKGY